jgi:hypothetical protein
MIDESKTEPKARPTATDRPAPASKQDDTELSDVALDKVVGGAAFNSSRSGIRRE